MSWYFLLAIAGAFLFTQFLLGIPIFVAFMLTIAIGTWMLIGPAGFSMLANSFYDTATTTSLASIPLFILMGEVLFRSGSMQVLFDSVDRLIGRVRGRQYVLTVTLSALFGALSGSAMAVAAMLGRAIMPDTAARGYDRKMMGGAILGGATLAPIIPPSILAIIVGTLANISIAQLLIAGILPGLMMAALFLIYISIRMRLRPDLAPPLDESVIRAPLSEKLRAVLRMLPFLVIIFMVMGLILLGIATPSESAATGVVGALITAAIYGRLSMRMVIQSFAAAAMIAAGILVIMITSKMFTQLLAFTGATRALVSLVTDLGLGPLTMLLMMLLLTFVLCMFVDQIAIMLILIPLFDPLIRAFGFDLTWFWMLFLFNMTLGGITPPMGYTIFAFQSVGPGMSLQDSYRAVIPFVLLFVVGIALMITFPQIVTLLPGLL